MYNECVEVFENKRAAPVDFTGHPGYAHMQPFTSRIMKEEKSTRMMKEMKLISRSLSRT